MFEFKEIKNSKGKEYTHHIYFKGKLFAKQAYRNKKGRFYYQDNVELNEKVFMAIPFSDFPDNFYLHNYKKDAYKEFAFGGAERKGNLLELNFWIGIDDFAENNPESDMFGFFFFLKLLAKKSSGIKFKFDDVTVDINYLCKSTGTIGDAYKEAIRELDRLYISVLKKVKEEETN